MASNKPNIVFVLIDDQGYGDLGCHGNPVLKTPNIDEFYSQSARFTDYHVGPTCAPTRAGLFCGHFANSTGVWHTVGGRSLLRRNETTIADVFSENGYNTGLFGKWHLGDNYPYRPQDRGFKCVVTHGGGGISQAPDYWGNDYFDDTYLVNGEYKNFEGYCTDVWFSEAEKFIEANSGSPFMCFITPNAPHSPFNVEEKYSAMYRDKVSHIERVNFYGMITNIDENFGRLIEKLKALDIYDDTIVIYMTDNGSTCMVEEAHTCGLRDFKGTPYEGGHRVPFFIRWKNGGLLESYDIDTLAANVDFMPTMMELCGIDTAGYEKIGFHGKSLKPLLTDKNAKWEQRTLVTDSQRLPNPVKWRQSAVMTEKWRLVNGHELYDIVNDLSQTTDVSKDYPLVVEKLRKDYEKWWDLVSENAQDDIPINIGGTEEEIRLCSHDWRKIGQEIITDPYSGEVKDYIAVNQSDIRNGYGEKGYWEVEVTNEGKYDIELRRWPKEEDKAITAGIKESDEGWRSDIILEQYRDSYSGGVALDLDKAHVIIGEIHETVSFDENHKKASFILELKKGKYNLEAWFSNEKGFEKGAYFVYINKA